MKASRIFSFVVGSIVFSFSLNGQVDSSPPTDSTQTPDIETPSSLNLTWRDLDSLYPKSPIYGHDLTTKGRFLPHDPDDVAGVGDRYVLGTGDELTISIFGAAQFDSRYIINQDGFIRPSNMPKIFLRGIEWIKAKKLIQSRFKQFYLFREDQFAASITKPRDITVHIIGEVVRPGTYRINAIHSVLQALSMAGGIEESGSVRNIQVTDGTITNELDIYQLLSDPKANFDLSLTEGTLIQVPIAKKIVEISGVKKEAQFELKQDEGLRTLLSFAGGIKGNSVKDFAQIYRFDGASKGLVEVDLRMILAGQDDVELADGDSIVIAEITEDSDEKVTITGAIKLSGDYALASNTMLSKLLAKARLKRNADLTAGFIQRYRPDQTVQIIEFDLEGILKGLKRDIALNARDRIVINSQVNALDKATIKVSGAVRRELEYPFSIDSTITIRQALLMSGGMRSNASDEGYIIRKGVNNAEEVEYIKINVRKAYNQVNSAYNQVMHPNDELVVLSNEDFTESRYINMSGAVRKPTRLQYANSLGVTDALRLSGGLLPSASGVIDIFRIRSVQGEPVRTISQTITIDQNANLLEPASFDLQPDDKLVARLKEEYATQSMISILGEAKFPGKYAIMSQNESLNTILSNAGGVTKEANLKGVHIERRKESVNANYGSLYYKVVVNHIDDPIVLLDGDRIVVPKLTHTVFIQANHTLFRKGDRVEIPITQGKNALWYINQYMGGLKHKKYRSNVVVQYANGAVKSSVKRLFGYSYPNIESGATIYVTQVEPEEKTIISGNFRKLRRGVIINVNDKESEGIETLPISNDDKQ